MMVIIILSIIIILRIGCFTKGSFSGIYKDY